jgi:hypothetical protein
MFALLRKPSLRLTHICYVSGTYENIIPVFANKQFKKKNESRQGVLSIAVPIKGILSGTSVESWQSRTTRTCWKIGNL